MMKPTDAEELEIIKQWIISDNRYKSDFHGIVSVCKSYCVELGLALKTRALTDAELCIALRITDLFPWIFDHYVSMFIVNPMRYAINGFAHRLRNAIEKVLTDRDINTLPLGRYVGDEWWTYREIWENRCRMLNRICKRSAVALVGIRQKRHSALSQLPSEIVLMIAKMWNDSKCERPWARSRMGSIEINFVEQKFILLNNWCKRSAFLILGIYRKRSSCLSRLPREIVLLIVKTRSIYSCELPCAWNRLRANLNQEFRIGGQKYKRSQKIQ